MNDESTGHATVQGSQRDDCNCRLDVWKNNWEKWAGGFCILSFAFCISPLRLFDGNGGLSDDAERQFFAHLALVQVNIIAHSEGASGAFRKTERGLVPLEVDGDDPG